MRGLIIGVAALAAIAFVACGGDDDEPLRNADEVRDEQQQQDRAKAEQEAQPVGTAIELEYDVRVTVQGADRLTADEMGGRSPSAPDAEWLAVNVLVENHGDDEISAPDMNITCADGREEGREIAHGDASEIDSARRTLRERASVRLAHGTNSSSFVAIWVLLYRTLCGNL